MIIELDLMRARDLELGDHEPLLHYVFLFGHSKIKTPMISINQRADDDDDDDERYRTVSSEHMSKHITM